MVFCDGRAVISSQIGAAPAFIWPFTYRCCTNIYLTFHISALHQHLSDHSHIGAAPAFIWPFTYRCCTSIYLTFHILALHQHLSDHSHIGAAPAFIWPFTYWRCTSIYLTFHISARENDKKLAHLQQWNPCGELMNTEWLSTNEVV